MIKKHCLTGQRSRAVLAQACSGVVVVFQPLEGRTLLTTAGLALDWGGLEDTAYEVAVDGRGRLVVSGDSDGTLIMARFTRSGDELVQDTGFGTEGGVGLDFEPFGIEIQPDGKILLVGDDAEGTLLVARYNENGTLDTTFADDGTAEFNLVPGAIGNAIAVQPDGKIVVAGATASPVASNDFVVVRFQRNGTLDTSFGNGGYVTADFNGGGDDVAKGLSVLPDGRIVVGGGSEINGEVKYAVARYMPDGSLDETLDGSAAGNGRISDEMLTIDDMVYTVTDFAAYPDGRMLFLAEYHDDGLLYPLAPDGRPIFDERMSSFRSGPHDELDIDGYEFTFTNTWHDEDSEQEDGSHNHDFSPGYDFGGDDVGGLEFDEYVLGVAVRDGNFAAVGYSGEDWAMTLSDVVAIQGPYTGAWHEPGQTIQAEDFDYGGEGVSYHDADVVNRGGEYRVGGVDVGYTSDTGGGFAVGWTQGGEWLEYTIDVPETGTYRFETRVANPAAGARFHYEVNGANLTGSMAVPATGGWHSFATVQSGIVNLTAGRHALRLAMDANASNGAIGNVNWLRFTEVDDGGGPGGGAGSLDETFGNNGIAIGPTDNGEVRPVTVAAAPGGKVVAAGGDLIVRRLADGSLDSTFGNNGILDTDFAQIADVAVQADGKIVAVGRSVGGGVRVARYTTTGQLDTRFSGDGIVTRTFGGKVANDYATGVAIQPDGRIVVVGAATTASRPNDTGFAIMRFTPSGAVDSTFDGDGYSIEQLTTFNEYATDVELDSNGRIVVSGNESTPRFEATVFRYNGNGSFDTSFSGDGRTTVPFNVNGIDIQTDNRIVLGGVDFESMADVGDRVARLTASGALDTTFGGGDGIVENVFAVQPFYSSVVNDVYILPGGDIAVAGWNEDRGTGAHDAVVTRLNADGSLDDSLAGEGNRYAVVPFSNRSDADSLTVQDGKLIVGGNRDDRTIAIARYLLDGGGTPTDTQKPTTPGSLRAQASYDRVVLNWDASSDNVGVVSYEIRRNDVRIATVGANQTSYTDTNVLPDEGYGYDVIAIDAAGNRSDEAFVNIMTPPAPGTGLRGVYYSNMDFTGTSITRTDAAVNFNWGTGGPSSTIGTDTFSVRWTGEVQAEKTERYTFYTRTDDGVRLWVNGQLLIDRWVPQSATEWSGNIDLRIGEMYTIRMEYFERFGQAVAELRWSSPTTPKQVVPTSRLYPGA